VYRIRNAVRAGADKLTGRQISRIEAGLQAGDPGSSGGLRIHQAPW
jgi:hypothetical protein